MTQHAQNAADAGRVPVTAHEEDAQGAEPARERGSWVSGLVTGTLAVSGAALAQHATTLTTAPSVNLAVGTYVVTLLAGVLLGVGLSREYPGLASWTLTRHRPRDHDDATTEAGSA